MTDLESTVVERKLSFGTLTFEEHPAGSRDAKGKLRTRDYRAYKLDGKRLPSVTTLLGAVIPAPGLIRWAEEQGARGAWQLAQDNELPDDEAEVIYAVRSRELGADAARERGAARGVNVHDLLREYLTTGSPPNPTDHDPEHRPYIQAVVRWLLDRKPEPRPDSIEQVVCHPKLGYAGRMDLRATIGLQDLVIDAKTQAKGNIYNKALLQAAMYLEADAYCSGDSAIGTLVVVFDAEGRYHELSGAANPRAVRAAVAMYDALKPLTRAADAHYKKVSAGREKAAR